MSRRAVALVLCLCMVGSAGLGVGGGYAAYQWAASQDNATASSSQEAAVNTALGSTSSQAQATASTGNAMTVEQIAAAAADSVVEITTEAVSTDQFMQQIISEGAGSGVIFSSDGYIVTNNHVIEGAQRITVTLRDGTSYDATLIGTDSETDVALLKIDATGLQAATLGDSSTLQVGETAVAIGNPLGQLGGTVTDGIISALDREITMDGKTMTLLQTNAAINPGNSGGGLFNDQGQLIGLVVAKSSGTGIEGLGFAIPVNLVKSVVEQLSTYGYVKGRVDLGMSLVDIDSIQSAMMYRVSQLGVYISQVEDGSNAQQAGFEAGDRIIAVNGTEISSTTDFESILSDLSVGDEISVQVERNGQTGTLTMALQEQTPDSQSSSSALSNLGLY
ncbi:MAG TPA: trypsin-like peptidase domain-containing protein [Candidatus Gallacutalibacter stercoravium]|nr:trypsin-like peptidase domain-containing protein [Candidatus Gallacutalibacter stercoravium]